MHIRPPAAFAVFAALALGHAAGCVEIDPAFYDSATSAADGAPSQTTTSSTPTTHQDSSGSETDGSSSGGTPGPSAATCEDLDQAVVFCTDFEEGHLDLWDDYDGNVSVENVLVLDPGARTALDNHVMRLRIPPGPGGVDLVKLLPGYYDRLYTRWYIKYESGYDMTHPGLGSGLHAGARDLLGASGRQPLGDDWFAVFQSHTAEASQPQARLDYRGQYQDCPNPETACFRDHLPCLEGDERCPKPPHQLAESTPPLLNGQWYCVEMAVDAGTPATEDAAADGVVELWLDGAPVGRWDDLWLRTDANLKLNILWLLLFHGGDHGDEGVLYDDVVVSRERVGCL